MKWMCSTFSPSTYSLDPMSFCLFKGFPNDNIHFSPAPPFSIHSPENILYFSSLKIVSPDLQLPLTPKFSTSLHCKTCRKNAFYLLSLFHLIHFLFRITVSLSSSTAPKRSCQYHLNSVECSRQFSHKTNQ